MTMQALLFTPDTKQNDPTPVEFRIETRQDAEECLKQALPVAFVVAGSDENVRHFKEYARLFERSAEKVAVKELSHYLLKAGRRQGKRQILLVEKDFLSAPQTLRSVRALMKQALRRQDANVYVVVVPPAVFDELCRILSKRRRTAAVAAAALRPKAAGREADFEDLLADFVPDKEVRKLYVGESPAIERIRKLIMMAGSIDAPVLITGETGTGKEIVARVIHTKSARGGTPMTAINCAALPPQLLESELFGYDQGAHNQAWRDKQGVWETAAASTLFLDEIGDLALESQGKILRAIEDGKIRRVGGVKDIPARPRIIAATNRDLAAMVGNGTFREDLYYRFCPVRIHTPPLREIAEDIPQIAQELWNGLTEGKYGPLSQEITEAMRVRDWPGNVRALRNALQGLLIFRQRPGAGPLTVRHLKFVLSEGLPRPEPGAGTATAQASAGFEPADCRRQLARAARVLREFRMDLRPFTVDKREDRRTRGAIANAWEERFLELDRLCVDPLLFNTHATFLAIYRLKGNLMRMQALLRAEPDQARVLWGSEVSGMIDKTIELLFTEAEALATK